MILTNYEDLLNELDTVERYQDIRINKETVVQGIRECETRYDYIKHAVTDPGRRFTILDIGANFGYYSIRLLEDFPMAFAVLIQPYDEAEVLKKVIELNTNIRDRVIILKTECRKENIARLSECEHFDLTLCLNILHHFDDPLAIYSSIKQMTRQLIIETPPVNDINACGQQHLAPIFDIVNQECHKKSSKGFQRQTLDSAYSHFYEYRFDTESDVVSEHVHGINLDTFFSLNGIYPSKSALLEKLNAENGAFKDYVSGALMLNETVSVAKWGCVAHAQGQKVTEAIAAHSPFHGA